MKLKILRLLVVLLAGASAVVVMTNAHAQKFSPSAMQLPLLEASALRSAQTPAAAAEKTTEQVQKNIKVLTGLPQSQLIPVMNYMASSLGRRCNYCHVNNNGQWDYVSDEKPEKNTAREMIKLVLDVNKNSFKGNVEVGCYTCHRGRNQPQSIPALPLPAPSPGPGNQGGQGRPAGPAGPGAAGQASPTPAPATPTADDIFNKYIAAIGGQAAIDKLASRTGKGTLVQANGNSLQFELLQSSPDKFYFLVTTPQGPFERGFNGQLGWEKTARGVREITGGELANFKAGNGLFVFIKLKEQYSRAPRVRRDKLNDRDVYVVDGTSTDNKRLRLFFDMETGLLLRRTTWTTTMVGLIPEQVDLEDYREVGGVKFAFIARTSTIEAGNPVSTRTFSEIKTNGPVEDSKFNMPKAATP